MPTAHDIFTAVVAETLRVPAAAGAPGDGAAAARQLDAALASAGFVCSTELLRDLSARHPVTVHEHGHRILAAVRTLVGDDVKHNAYFKRFPDGVPDTLAFWTECITNALMDPRAAGVVAAQLKAGQVNLLDLPTYGRYQHTYEQMLAVHDQLVASAKDRVTVLHLGGSLVEESQRLYVQLAGSPVALHEEELDLLATLAELHVHDAQPAIDVRENRAIVNAVRLRHGQPIDVDTVTDILRLAHALSDGDVTLTTPTRLRSFRRPERRALMQALDTIVAANTNKIADVHRHTEPFKRLAERLHPHEYEQFPHARDVFAVARGERQALTLAGQVERVIGRDPDSAVQLLATAPGMLIRAIDRLARAGADQTLLAEAVRQAVPNTSTRVIAQVREHLLNRWVPDRARIFVNQEGRTWVTPDRRTTLAPTLTTALAQVLDQELTRRLPQPRHLVIEPAVRTIAIPTSNKTKPGGLGILPRGSRLPADGTIRFFVYWKERQHRTDYDLSVQLLDQTFGLAGHVSYTNLSEHGAVHSGDIVEAPDGASEFIDIDLSRVRAAYVVPQVNIYAGEGFDQAEQAFFGFMLRDPANAGAPFEPTTVQAKSDLFGAGRVALPLVFARGHDDHWTAQWTHLNLRGRPNFNQVENNHRNTSLLVSALVNRRYLQVGDIEAMIWAEGARASEWPCALDPTEPVTFIGLNRPDGLPAGSTVYTPQNLSDLLL